MTLADYGISCEGGACSVRIAPLSPDEIAALIIEVQRGWLWRGEPGKEAEDESWARSKLSPLAARLGVDPALILISPALAAWWS
jgi:hypothetical protein